MRKTLIAALFVLVFMMAFGCATVPKSGHEKDALHHDVMSAIATAKAKDPSIESWFNSAYGYAVFPNVGKGGIGVGGAFGRGEVFEKGRVIGFISLKQATVGFQLGGQTYSEMVFFKDKLSLDRLRYGSIELSAQASAVAVTAGAGKSTDYSDGLAVFVFTKGGLMYEATVGGQKFDFVPK